MKKNFYKLFTLLVLAVVLGIFVVGFGGNQTIVGGDPIQQEQISAVLSDSSFNFDTVNEAFGRPISIAIMPHWENYWDVAQIYQEPYGAPEDIAKSTLGVAYSDGRIYLAQYDYRDTTNTSLSVKPLLTEVTMHEIGHAVWFDNRVWRLNSQMVLEWTDLVTDDQHIPDYSAWYDSPAENFAEHFKFFVTKDKRDLIWPWIRTNLKILPEEVFISFLQKWWGADAVVGATTTTTASTTTTTLPSTTTTTTVIPTTTTTTTTIPKPPLAQYFKDISPSFYAYKEIQYAYEAGYFKGYVDSTFRPYGLMTMGHVHNILHDGIVDVNYFTLAPRFFASDMMEIPLYGRGDMNVIQNDTVTRAQMAILIYSRDKGERVPSADNQLVGYFNRSDQELAYLTSGHPNAKLTVSKATLVELYNFWGPVFGIRADFAFAQAMYETGGFEYGGQVKWTDNNFAGLGADGISIPAKFKTAELGVIAHYAHLASYAYPTDLNLDQCSKTYDPRHDHSIYWKMHLKPEIAPTLWKQLNGIWAVPGTSYAQNIAKIAMNFYK